MLLCKIEAIYQTRSLNSCLPEHCNVFCQPFSSVSIHVSVFSLNLHRATKTGNTQAPVSNTLFWQEAIDQDVGRALIGGFFNAGVSRLSLWGLHLVLGVGFIMLNQFFPLMQLWVQETGPNGNTSSTSEKMHWEKQPLMSDKCVNIVKVLDHQGWLC